MITNKYRNCQSETIYLRAGSASALRTIQSLLRGRKLKGLAFAVTKTQRSPPPHYVIF